MKIKLSERLIDYLIQAIFIFISVFLAFWLNNYQVEQENIRLTKNVKEALYQELTTNLEYLEKSEPFMKALSKSQIQFYKHQLDTVTRFDLGLIPQMRKPHTRLILSIGAANLVDDARVKLHPYVKTRIYSVYKQQELVMEAQRKLFDDFFASIQQYDHNLAKENYYIFFQLANNMLGKEQIAIANLKEVIKMINN